jgi:polyphenol oxidase
MLLTSPSLSRLSGIAHAFFTRAGGVSEGVYASLNGGLGSGDERGRVIENRKRMAAALGVAPESFATVFQVHSPDVIVVDEPWNEGVRPLADAMVTRRPGLAIAVSSADCGPLLFADEEARVIGAAHAGWKGALAGVIEATIAAMEGQGAGRARMHVALGPMISRAAYEVGPEFKARFLEADAAHEKFFTPSPRDGRSMFDLPAFIGERLRQAGIGNIDDLGRCTHGEEALFFSYRRMTHRGETDYGRHLSAIALTT